MTFIKAIKTCFRKYATFSGHASRPEFWWFVLLLATASLVAGNVPIIRFEDELTRSVSFGIFFGLGPRPTWTVNIYTALFTISFLAVLSRRIQDVGYAGSNLIVFPFVAYAASMLVLKAFPTQQVLTGLNYVNLAIFACILLIVALSRSQSSSNQYGPNPMEATS